MDDVKPDTPVPIGPRASGSASAAEAPRERAVAAIGVRRRRPVALLAVGAVAPNRRADRAGAGDQRRLSQVVSALNKRR